MPKPETSTDSIAVVAFDLISPFHLATPCVVFGESHPGCPPIDFKVCAAESGRLRTSAGFDIDVRYGLSALQHAATIIVPSWRDVAESPPKSLLKALNVAHERGAKIVGLCLGAFVLAEAGLLDGRKTCVSWYHRSDYVEEFGIAPIADIGTRISPAKAGLYCSL